MSRYFDVPGDLDLKPDGTGLLFVSGLQRLRQRLVIGLGFPVGSWAFDEAVGFPTENILERPSTEIAQHHFAKWLSAQPEITDVVNVTVSLDRASREFRFEFHVKTVWGDEIKDLFILGAK